MLSGVCIGCGRTEWGVGGLNEVWMNLVGCAELGVDGLVECVCVCELRVCVCMCVCATSISLD